jgi:hypothetical protein
VNKTKKPTFVGFFVSFSEREKGFEPSTSTLARWHSTAELLPRKGAPSTSRGGVCQASGFIFDNFGRPVEGAVGGAPAVRSGRPRAPGFGQSAPSKKSTLPVTRSYSQPTTVRPLLSRSSSSKREP